MEIAGGDQNSSGRDKSITDFGGDTCDASRNVRIAAKCSNSSHCMAGPYIGPIYGDEIINQMPQELAKSRVDLY